MDAKGFMIKRYKPIHQGRKLKYQTLQLFWNKRCPTLKEIQFKNKKTLQEIKVKHKIPRVPYIVLIT